MSGMSLVLFVLQLCISENSFQKICIICDELHQEKLGMCLHAGSIKHKELKEVCFEFFPNCLFLVVEFTKLKDCQSSVVSIIPPLQDVRGQLYKFLIKHLPVIYYQLSKKVYIQIIIYQSYSIYQSQLLALYTLHTVHPVKYTVHISFKTQQCLLNLIPKWQLTGFMRQFVFSLYSQKCSW